MVQLGNFTFEEGDTIKIGAYDIEVRRGMFMQKGYGAKGGVWYKDFDSGILLLLLVYVPMWSIEHKEEGK